MTYFIDLDVAYDDATIEACLERIVPNSLRYTVIDTGVAHGWPVVRFAGQFSELAPFVLKNWDCGDDDENKYLVDHIQRIPDGPLLATKANMLLVKHVADVVVYSPVTGQTMSANANNYFDLEDDSAPIKDASDTPMILARREVTFADVTL